VSGLIAPMQRKVLVVMKCLRPTSLFSFRNVRIVFAYKVELSLT